MKVYDISDSTIFQLCYPLFPLYIRNGATLGINDIAPWPPHLFRLSGSLASSVEDYCCLVTFSSYRFSFLFSSLLSGVLGLVFSAWELVGLFGSFSVSESLVVVLGLLSLSFARGISAFVVLHIPVNGVTSSRSSVVCNEVIVVCGPFTKVRAELRTPAFTECRGLTVE